MKDMELLFSYMYTKLLKRLNNRLVIITVCYLKKKPIYV